jgi:hypothetical protein
MAFGRYGFVTNRRRLKLAVQGDNASFLLKSAGGAYSAIQTPTDDGCADTLTTSLPTHPADQLATKTDIDRLEDRFDRLEDRIDQAIRTFTVITVGAMTALTGIFCVIVGVFS